MMPWDPFLLSGWREPSGLGGPPPDSRLIPKARTDPTMMLWDPFLLSG